MRVARPSTPTMRRDTHDGTPLPILSRDPTRVRDVMAGTALIALACIAAVLWIAWQAIRLPLLAILVILEPIVTFMLSVLALLITLTALFWVLVDPRVHFPFWTVLSASLVCVLVLALYHVLIRALSSVVPFRSCTARPTSRR